MWFLDNAWYLFMIEAAVILVLWDITETRKDDDEEDKCSPDTKNGKSEKDF